MVKKRPPADGDVLDSVNGDAADDRDFAAVHVAAMEHGGNR